MLSFSVILLLYSTVLYISFQEKFLDKFYVLKHPKFIQPAKYISVFKDSEKFICLLNVLLGDREACGNTKWGGLYIKNPDEFPSNIMILDIKSDLLEMEGSSPIYVTHDAHLVDKLFQSLTMNPNLIMITSKPDVDPDNSKIIFDTTNFLLRTNEKSIKLSAQIHHLGEAESELKIKKSPYLMITLLWKHWPQLLSELSRNSSSTNFFYYEVLTSDISAIKDLQKLVSLPQDGLVLVRRSSSTSSSDIEPQVVHQYTQGKCVMRDKVVSCKKGITESHRRSLCSIGSGFISNLNQFCAPDYEKSIIMAQRSVSQQNPHNLYTYAEYDSNYAAMFIMCAASFIFIVVVFIVAILSIAQIDISAHSILNKDATLKQKIE